MKYDLSVIIPSIHPDRLYELHSQMEKSIGSYSFELICVGPHLPPQELYEKNNFKFYIDYGCPARCFQIGSCFSDATYLAFIPDDARIEVNAFSECLRVAKANTPKDGMTLRYSEGVGFTGTQDQDDAYWIAHTHDDMKKLPGVKAGWRTAPLFMYNTEYFRDVGGLDCRFEHVNMNTHDLAFRTQRYGGKIIPSPVKVAALDWNPGYASSVLFQAYIQNDNPLFSQLYAVDDPGRYKIDYSNWVRIPSHWPRKYP